MAAATFTPEERRAVNALLLHARASGDAEAFAALERLAADPAAFRAVLAEFDDDDDPA